MRKANIIVLILLFSLNLFGQNPEEVVEKCIDVLGGEGAAKKFSSYQAKGEMKIAMRGMELSGKLESILLDGKSWNRTELAFGQEVYTMIQAYDGKTAWMDRMGTIVDQPSLNYESDSDHGIFLLAEKDSKFSFTKEKEIDGRKAVGIEVDFKGKKTTFYIDKENSTVLEMVYKDLYFGEKYTKEMLEKRIRFADYRSIENVFFPLHMTFYQEGKKLMEFQFSEVTFKPEVSLARFKRPDQKLDLRYSEERIH
ncbi:MAG: DUF4292 domain-containing protein [Candidatus Aminicenantes bacterium]|nr:MAG: DUF4292 domain-containing protein [Candidatus Aminicenantes bacterium]